MTTNELLHPAVTATTTRQLPDWMGPARAAGKDNFTSYPGLEERERERGKKRIRDPSVVDMINTRIPQDPPGGLSFSFRFQLVESLWANEVGPQTAFFSTDHKNNKVVLHVVLPVLRSNSLAALCRRISFSYTLQSHGVKHNFVWDFLLRHHLLFVFHAFLRQQWHNWPRKGNKLDLQMIQGDKGNVLTREVVVVQPIETCEKEQLMDVVVFGCYTEKSGATSPRCLCSTISFIFISYTHIIAHISADLFCLVHRDTMCVRRVQTTRIQHLT